MSAVLIATPEHWHRDQFIDALSAGKIVYLETPVSHTIDEANEMVAAASESKQIVQVGTQEVTQLQQLEELVDAFDVELTAEDITTLEEPYRPRRILGM